MEPIDSPIDRVLADEDQLALVIAALPDADEVLAVAAVARLWATQSRDERVWLALYMKRWGAHSAEPPLHDLRAGDVAEFCGLVSRAELNGKSTRLIRWLEESQRWVAERNAVGTDGSSQIKVRPQNLTGTWRWRHHHREKISRPHRIEHGRSGVALFTLTMTRVALFTLTATLVALFTLTGPCGTVHPHPHRDPSGTVHPHRDPSGTVRPHPHRDPSPDPDPDPNPSPNLGVTLILTPTRALI